MRARAEAPSGHSFDRTIMTLDRRLFLKCSALAALPAASLALSAPAALAAIDHKALDAQALHLAANAEPFDPIYRRQLVAYEGRERPGSIVVDTHNFFLYLVFEGGQALRYGCGIGREGFSWSGRADVARKAVWPNWYPPADMRKRQPELPLMMAGGIDNPMGARALYLHQNGRDTLYRIHGTSEAASIGQAVSSGCVRLMNDEVMDLYQRVPVGTRVLVI
ncbi:L,D-transpeptidase [Chelatococcus sp. SYSU_G07232]|uniref:L,D-transpeptidase n=1 Tax=Chelatococcus albus TaxID=3047466 RepID=A0ABT7AEC3_9HYPH|nr:L,D-transpeptidase [Chelatococcus sp. SYSU_G07232]MDJ1156971.1 L,D-transpeptidase [Chelatococcus sp. SYSU_G07232]